MALSKAVNYISFLNGVVNRCRYIDKTLVSNEDKQTILQMFLDNYSLYLPDNLHTTIPLKKAVFLLTEFTNRTDVISYPTDYGLTALSAKTAKKLLDRVTIDEYSVFSHILTLCSSSFNEVNYKPYRMRVLTTSSFTLKGTLIGGGGGGSGGATSDGNSKISVYLRVPAGASGTSSTLRFGASTFTATGGAGGGTNNHDITSDTDYPYRWNGTDGSAGAQTAVEGTLGSYAIIQVENGSGGGGSGGVAAKASGNATITSGAGDGLNGGNGSGNNGFSDQDGAAAGGGGGSISYTVDYYGVTETSGSVGTNYRSGQQLKDDVVATLSSNGIGGTGGYAKNITQSANDNMVGAGGKGGTTNYDDDDWCASAGGNAGNNGGFVADSSMTDYLVMVKGAYEW